MWFIFLKAKNSLKMVKRRKIFLKFFTIQLLLVCHLMEAIEPVGTEKDNASTCLLKNLKYPNEYMLTRNKLIILGNKFYFKRKTQLVRTDKVDNIDHLKWNLVRANSNGINDTFYIKSRLYPSDYFCAVNEFDDLFKIKRLVKRLTLPPFFPEETSCQWTFERASSHSKWFTIRNQLYKQLLYAAMLSFSPFKEGRNVYLWHNPQVKITSEFMWNIEC
jgi:hypothetical protein